MKKLTTILLLIGMSLSIGTVQGQTLQHIQINAYCDGPDYSMTSSETLPSGTLYLSLDSNMTDSSVAVYPVIGWTENGIISYNGGDQPTEEDTLYMYTFNTVGGVNYDELIYSFTVNHSPEPRICLVTTDGLSGNKEIIIDESYLSSADSVVLERQTVGGWEIVDSLVTTTSVFDSTYPSGQTLTYRLRSTYGCESDEHETILLSATLDLITGDANLIWTEYVGNINDVIDGYYVLRDNGPTTDTIAAVPGTNLNGVTYTPGDQFRVEAYKEACNINPFGRAGLLTISSNIEDPSTVGINDIYEQIDFTMINPSNGLRLTTDKTVDVDVFDLNGRLLRTYNQVSHLNDDTYTNGMYLVVIKDDMNWIAKKLIID